VHGCFSEVSCPRHAKKFGSTEDDTQSMQDAIRTTSQLRYSDTKKIRKKRSTLLNSFFATTLTKTADIRVGSTKPNDDDFQLIVLNLSDNSVAGGSDEVQRAVDSLYREQQITTKPRR
jgi:hypothetical protein